ncbi:MAG: hypothetical protein HAW62_02890 [Endozoicomonadaceae bacterium]|nr:hypothetical protein [Endozoicomonadaceae bacterium]
MQSQATLACNKSLLPLQVKDEVLHAKYRVTIESEAVQLTGCLITGHDLCSIASSRVKRTGVMSIQLTIGFLNNIDDINSVRSFYRNIWNPREFDTDAFTPTREFINKHFDSKISLSGYYSNNQHFDQLMQYIFNIGEMDSIRRYIFFIDTHPMALIMKRTAYNQGWIIAYDAHVIFQCMIFKIQNTIQEDDMPCSYESWNTLRQFMHQQVSFACNEVINISSLQTIDPDSDTLFDIRSLSFLNMNMFNSMLSHGHYGLTLEAKLPKIPWDLKAFGLENLQKIREVLESGNGLFMAFSHGHVCSIRTFFQQLDVLLKRLDTSSQAVQLALESILLAKYSDNKVSGWILACQLNDATIFRIVFEWITQWVQEYPHLKNILCNILFYHHRSEYSTLRAISQNQDSVCIQEVLEWPKKINIDVSLTHEKVRIQNWFASIHHQIAGKSTSDSREMLAVVNVFQIKWITTHCDNIKEISDCLKLGKKMYFAYQDGDIQFISDIFTCLQAYLTAGKTLLDSDKKALEDILLSEDPSTTYIGFLMACRHGHTDVIRSVLTFMKDLSINQPALTKDLLKTVLKASLHASISANQIESVRELLTWPEKIDLKEKSQFIRSWFEPLCINKPSVFELTLSYVTKGRAEIINELYQFQIKWILSSFKTLDELSDYFYHQNILSFALKYGFIKPVCLLLDYLDVYLQEPFMLSEQDIQALGRIFRYNSQWIVSGQDEYKEMVQVVFEYIENMSKKQGLQKESQNILLCFQGRY